MSPLLTDAQIEALPLDECEAELRDAILATAVPPPAHRPVRVRGWSIAGLAATATAAVLAVALIGGGDKLGTSPERAWAAPAVRVANAVPRLLLGEAGWKVTRADQFRVEEGEMSFSKDGRTLDLHWRGTDDHVDWVKDRAHSSKRLPDVRVLGATARVFEYDGSNRDFTALWRAGEYTMELRTSGAEGVARLTAQEYSALLASLKQVSVDEWLSAMPPSVVLPVDSEETIDAMLAELPLPEGFDKSALLGDESVRDRYQLGARVSGAVACAWIAQWADAKKAGDDGARDEAVAAMATARDWPILREMNAAGDYPEVVWDYADAIAGDATITAGKTLTVEESVDAALGC